MKYVDYYAALGLSRDADATQIKKAYRTLARQHHPDMSKAPGAEERFKNAAAAYATLKNPEKRAAYDALGIHREGADMDDAPRGGDGFDNAHSFKARRQEEMAFADFLESLGKGGYFGDGHPHASVAQRGQDMEDTVQIDLVQALHGGLLHLSLLDQGERREFEITLPAGVRAGQQLRLRGKGGRGRNGGMDGDLYLHMAFQPHPRFRVDQHDLYFDLPLSPWEATLGADVSVPTLEGEVTLTVPPGSGSGKKLRLRGRGLPKGTLAQPKRGDLYAVVRVDVPKELSPEEQRLMEQLQRVSTFSSRPIHFGTTPSTNILLTDPSCTAWI